MAYLTFAGSEEKQSSCFKFIGTTSGASRNDNLNSNTVSLILPSNSSTFGEDSCSFYSGPSDATIIAFGESYESCGIVAYNDSSNSGGYSSGGESCGIVASCSNSSSSSFSGGGCSYSC
mgnify:CR=1 FL=1